jgi:hypothetical protein
VASWTSLTYQARPFVLVLVLLYSCSSFCTRTFLNQDIVFAFRHLLAHLSCTTVENQQILSVFARNSTNLENRKFYEGSRNYEGSSNRNYEGHMMVNLPLPRADYTAHPLPDRLFCRDLLRGSSQWPLPEPPYIGVAQLCSSTPL